MINGIIFSIALTILPIVVLLLLFFLLVDVFKLKEKTSIEIAGSISLLTAVILMIVGF